MVKKTKKKKDLRVWVPVCLVVPILVLLVAAVIVSAVMGGSGAALRNYVELTMSANGGELFALFPNGAIQYLEDETGATAKEMQELLQSRLDDGLKARFTSVIGDVESYSYEITEKSEPEDSLITGIETNYGVTVTDAVYYELTVTANGQNGTVSRDWTVGFVRIDGKWCLYNLQMLI